MQVAWNINILQQCILHLCTRLSLFGNDWEWQWMGTLFVEGSANNSCKVSPLRSCQNYKIIMKSLSKLSVVTFFLAEVIIVIFTKVLQAWLVWLINFVTLLSVGQKIRPCFWIWDSQDAFGSVIFRTIKQAITVFTWHIYQRSARLTNSLLS